jgi:hypothetical protein
LITSKGATTHRVVTPEIAPASPSLQSMLAADKCSVRTDDRTDGLDVFEFVGLPKSLASFVIVAPRERGETRARG